MDRSTSSNTTAMPTMKLELVPIPVTDIDSARDFYVGKIGFHLDHDVRPSDGRRIVQLTPPGSGCSILLSAGMGEISEMQAGSLRGLHLVVADIRQVRNLLLERGVEIGSIDEYPDGIKFAHFKDPDGNLWLLQEVPANL